MTGKIRSWLVRDHEQNKIKAFGVGPEQKQQKFQNDTGEDAEPSDDKGEKSEHQNELKRKENLEMSQNKKPNLRLTQ